MRQYEYPISMLRAGRTYGSFLRLRLGHLRYRSKSCLSCGPYCETVLRFRLFFPSEAPPPPPKGFILARLGPQDADQTLETVFSAVYEQREGPAIQTGRIVLRPCRTTLFALYLRHQPLPNIVQTVVSSPTHCSSSGRCCNRHFLSSVFPVL